MKRISEYTLEHLAQRKLRHEDYCGVMRLTNKCQDMEMKVREIYKEVGLW